MFDKTDDVITVDISDVVPVDDAASTDSDDESGTSSDSDSLHASDDDDDNLPVYLWRPGQCNDVMADWEKHTKVEAIRNSYIQQIAICVCAFVLRLLCLST